MAVIVDHRELYTARGGDNENDDGNDDDNDGIWMESTTVNFATMSRRIVALLMMAIAIEVP